jgi:hypothetical protein
MLPEPRLRSLERRTEVLKSLTRSSSSDSSASMVVAATSIGDGRKAKRGANATCGETWNPAMTCTREHRLLSGPMQDPCQGGSHEIPGDQDRSQHTVHRGDEIWQTPNAERVWREHKRRNPSSRGRRKRRAPGGSQSGSLSRRRSRVRKSPCAAARGTTVDRS